MLKIAAIVAAAALCAQAKVNTASIASATTIAVNVIGIDQTVKRTWKALKVSRRVVVKTAKKAVGK